MTNPDKSLIVVFSVSVVQWEVTCPAVTYNNIFHITFTLHVHKLTFKSDAEGTVVEFF